MNSKDRIILFVSEKRLFMKYEKGHTTPSVDLSCRYSF